MSSNASIMLWAQRICSKRGEPPHVLLEVKKDATLEEATQAFHKIARIAHPDLHRNSLTPDELEMLTAAYAIVAGAYQAFRSPVMSSTQMKPIREAGSGPTAAPAPAKAAVPTTITPVGSPPGNAATAMSSKALVYYRKAEAALKRGDLKSAILQIKLAIATDPQSAFLRTALAEAEAEVAKGGR